MSAPPGRAILAGSLSPLLLRDWAVEGRGRAAKAADGSACVGEMALGEGCEEGWAGSSQEPLQGLLWPEVDVESMPGAGKAKRLGVVGSSPAADSKLSPWPGCFVSAAAARLTSEASPCNQAVNTWQPAKICKPKGVTEQEQDSRSKNLHVKMYVDSVPIQPSERGESRLYVPRSSPCWSGCCCSAALVSSLEQSCVAAG